MALFTSSTCKCANTPLSGLWSWGAAEQPDHGLQYSSARDTASGALNSSQESLLVPRPVAGMALQQMFCQAPGLRAADMAPGT